MNGKPVGDITTFSFEGHDLRVSDIDGDLWFVASDAAASLAYRDATDLARTLDADEKGTQIVRTSSGDQTMIVISEAGLYRAIMQRRISKKLTAERREGIARFQRWVYHDVLPTIRKTGAYVHEGVTVSELDATTRRAIGGMIKANAGVVIREALAPVQAELKQTQIELADLREKVRPDAIRRQGVPAKTIWDMNRLPPLKCGTVWLGNKLMKMGAGMEFGQRADIGGKAVRLFDPDRAKHCMENGLLITARKYVAERQGQGKLNLKG